MNVVAGETKGKLVVLVTHDTAEAEFFGGRIISI
jgi:ABC-type nitrate/sulfonate/bicarbonate transport system ATPase subunit